MHLHLAVDAGVVAALEVHPLPPLPQMAGSPTRLMRRSLRLGSSASMRRISRATSDGSIFTPVLGVPVQP